MIKRALTFDDFDEFDNGSFTGNISAFAVPPVILSHFYAGEAGYDSICKQCDQPRSHPSHFRNRGVICDNQNGPCACGTNHKKI